MGAFKTRWIEARLGAALSAVPVVVITGARQTGKSTLARSAEQLRGRPYYTLDRLDILDLAKRAPEELLRSLPLTIDEIQRAPGMLLAVKLRVDEARQRGEAINGAIALTGSANLALMEGVSESLAGRASYLHLAPFCPGEWLESSEALSALDSLFAAKFDAASWRPGATDWEGWAVRGGYPDALAQGNPAARDEWFSGYVDTYLERDLRQLANIAHLPDFKRLMRLLAGRSARLLNQADLARDVQIPGATAHRYLNLLETGHLITRLPNYRASVTSSLNKARKVLWGDVGLALWLAGVDASTVRTRPDSGFWLEQLVYQTLQAWAVQAPRRTVSFWRDGAAEVDFVLEQNGHLVAMEIKSSPTVTQDDLRGLRTFQASFANAHKEVPLAVVIHPGVCALSHGGNVWSLPLHLFAPAG